MAELRELVDRRALGRCEACRVHYLASCNGRSEHPHHVHPTGTGGPDTLENLLATSSTHHRWIHEHPREARSLGLLI